MEYGVRVEPGRNETQSIGPVSSNLLQCEYLRFEKTYNKIVEEGFTNNHQGSGVIGCYVLQKKGKRVFHIIDGLHRSAALIILQHERLPLSVRGPVVEFDKLKDLPPVTSGLISLEDAEKFFNFIFDE